MNYAAIVLAVFLAAGAVLGIFIIAGNQPTSYQDSYGNSTSESTNATMGIISNVTSPISEMGGGLVLFLGAIALLGASVMIYTAIQRNGYHGGRG